MGKHGAGIPELYQLTNDAISEYLKKKSESFTDVGEWEIAEDYLEASERIRRLNKEYKLLRESYMD